MTTWQGKTRGGLTGYRIFITVIRYAGITPAYILLVFVAFWFTLFSGRSTLNIYNFYRHRLGYGALKSVINIYRNYYVFGQVLIDKTAVMAGLPSKFSFNFDGEEYLRKMVTDGTGGILISGHIGNFEMAGQMLDRLDTTVNILMVDAEYEKIKNYLSSFTTKTFNIIPVKDDGSHVFELKTALENREIVCIHGDRFTRGSRKILQMFLGKKAFFPAGPFYVALQNDVPVSFVFAMKEKTRGYHFYASAPVNYYRELAGMKRKEAVNAVLDDYTQAFEKMIKKYPLQWFNYYDFWKNDE